jgi:hypothetical protein
MINLHVTAPTVHQINNYVPVVYIAQDVMILMRATSITRAIGRGGRALKIEKCLGSEIATSGHSNYKKIKQQKKHVAMGYRSQAHLICLNGTL